MRIRCLNPKATGYARYGGAGVTICKRWDSFENFYKDMGPRPEGHSLERIDGSKGYTPKNCRWATPREQCNNRKSNAPITFDGKTQSAFLWAQELGMKYATLKNRIQLGWPLERAFQTPVGPRNLKLGSKVRRLYATGRYTQRALAKKFGVTPSLISRHILHNAP